jgi:predicted NBD/HSP70 family sugar kinase
MVLTDLSGNIIGEQQIPSGAMTPKQLGDALAKFLRGVEGKKVGAIGLALSGLVDASNGVCVLSRALGWDNVPIAHLLEERFSLPVFIENDANALAMAALVFGQLGHAQSAVIATFGKGIGAGILLDRQLYRGRHGKAGEIGVSLLGDGSERLLEDVASSQAILQRVAATAKDDVPSTLRDLDVRPTAEVLSALAEAGQHLGMSLANLSVASRILLDHITQSFQTYRLKLTPHMTPLQFLTESNRMWAQGAAGFAVNKLLDLLAAQADEEIAL